MKQESPPQTPQIDIGAGSASVPQPSSAAARHPAHGPTHPLTPSLSPSGGEGARRAGEGERSSDSLRAFEPPPHIHDHELLCRIGQGSYGEVWLARSAVGTLRAVKIVHRQSFERVEHFEREFKGLQKFEPISRSHDGLVDILQIGRDDAAGYFYYVMELADDALVVPPSGGPELDGHWTAEPAEAGTTNAARLKAGLQTYAPKTLRAAQQRHGRLPVHECLQIGLALASALEHLHAHGLVHRDIKPSNIIFVDGAPKLADIGLVAHIDDARSLVGTAGYIPPEGPGTPQADLYSLGKVLYEISLGKDRQDFPQLPPDLQSHRDHAALLELNEVILKACESDFRQRYQTAQQMHDDLALLQRGQSVKRQRAVERRFAFAKGFASLMLAFTAVVVVGWVWLDSPRSTLSEVQKRHAHQLYLQACSEIAKQTEEGTRQAIALSHQVLAIDPQHAPAYAGLAEAYVSLTGWHLHPKEAMPAAKWAATKALEINEADATAHFWLGVAKQRYDFDWVGAEKEFQRVVQLDPAFGHNGYALLLWTLGRLDDSRRELEIVLRATPHHPIRNYNLGLQCLFERRYDEAIARGHKLVTANTNFFPGHWLLLRAYTHKGMRVEAIAAAERVRVLDDGPDVLAVRAHLLALMGRTDDARQLLKKLEELAEYRFVSGDLRAMVHAALGEKEQAMDWLERSYEERSLGMVVLKVDPAWDGIRLHPRFAALLKKLNLEP